MDLEQWGNELVQKLWGDISAKGEWTVRAPLLAHYTSIETLEKILQGDEIWLSHPFFMNDLQELRHGMQIGAGAFAQSPLIREACGTADAHQRLIGSFNYWWQEYEREHVLDTYVLSFSAHEKNDNDGLLSMWRGYGAEGRGVALVFDPKRIQSLPGSPLLIDKVEYIDEEQRAAWINKTLTILIGTLRACEKSEQQLKLLARVYLERLKIFSLFSKHAGFSEEREWRMVYRREADHGNHFGRMLGHVVTKRGVEPKLKIAVKELREPFKAYDGIEKVLDRIILGPSRSDDLTRALMVRMLKGMSKEVQVVASSLPFRPSTT